MEGIKNPEVIRKNGKEYLKVPVNPEQGPCGGCIFCRDGSEEEKMACLESPWCGPRFIFISVKDVPEENYEN